jgi:hypothetical protein
VLPVPNGDILACVGSRCAELDLFASLGMVLLSSRATLQESRWSMPQYDFLCQACKGFFNSKIGASPTERVT